METSAFDAGSIESGDRGFVFLYHFRIAVDMDAAEHVHLSALDPKAVKRTCLDLVGEILGFFAKSRILFRINELVVFWDGLLERCWFDTQQAC